MTQLTQNTAKYNECHAAAANNYLACAEDDVICRCAQLQVLSEQCAPLCPAVSISNQHSTLTLAQGDMIHETYH